MPPGGTVEGQRSNAEGDAEMVASGRKTGGRKAGVPNRKTKDVEEILASLGCDPIRGMAKIALNPRASLELRGRMNAELAHYVYPKRKAVEHRITEVDSTPSKVEIVLVPAIDGRPVRDAGQAAPDNHRQY